MTKTTTLKLGSQSIQQENRTSTHPVVRGRMGMAAALTALAVAIGVVFGVVWGTLGVALFALTLPVPLTLLWLSADVVRADERKTR
jgi:uncharacterized membrane protein